MTDDRESVDIAVKLTRDTAGSDNGRRLVPVVTDDGATGMVTPQDQLLTAAAQDATAHGSSTVADVCVPSPVTLRPDDTLRRAAYLFAEHDVTQAPVVSHGPDERVVGTVTLHHPLHARRHDLTGEHHRQRPAPRQPPTCPGRRPHLSLTGPSSRRGPRSRVGAFARRRVRASARSR
ncbi:CBS domain-containing protein, partial [Streptomyces noursei]|uniref:CBS domain-containing protein n=1 Tax=Streptomyces noursei TaxID=1971 RepID=UPI001E47A6BC